jgi:hypothetical protein
VDCDYLTSDTPFGTDCLLLSQVVDYRKSLDPLRRLMLSVLVDAIRCFQLSDDVKSQTRRRDSAETQQWLFNAESDGPFSFDTVCYALQIDANHLRRTLAEWRTKRFSRQNTLRVV